MCSCSDRGWKVVFVVLLALSALPFVSPPVALAMGIAFALCGRPVFPKFTKMTQKYLLQGCVVGLGFGMNLEKALASGRDGMLMTVVSVVVVMVLGWVLGRFLKVEKRTSYLVSAGTAICGGSAIAAVGPLVDAKEDEMSVSLGTIFVLNAVALFVFPPIGHALGMEQIQFGEWAAIAIHDTSSVVGAGTAYGESALEVAALVKCTRALWILPLAVVTMLLWRKKGSRVAVPWFIFLFALAMVINTYLPLPEGLTKGIVCVAKRGFAVTLFLIGTGLTLKTLKSCGIRPFIQGVSLWLIISVLGVLTVTCCK
ncbi:MAG: YeiH family protein [Kiritimatiellia bacterium]